MKLRKIFLLICVLFGTAYITHSQLYTYRHYGQEDGLNLTSFLTVNESKEGYLWFGSDGAGLMRFDGKNFDYLEKIQGRANKHVSHITFNNNKVLFTTLYNGTFLLENDTLTKLSYKTVGSNQGLFCLGSENILLQDGGIRVYSDSLLIDEEITYPYKISTRFYGSFKTYNSLMVFTSKGNYFIEDNKIENLNEWLVTDKDITKNMVSAYKTGDSIVLIDKYLKNEITVLMDGSRPKFFIKGHLKNQLLDTNEVVLSWDVRGNNFVAVTNSGRIIKRNIKSGVFEEILHNSIRRIIAPSDILIDRNQDIWVTTKSNGIFKISLEPFTLISKNPIFQSHLIDFIGKTKDDKMILSIGGKKSYIGSEENNNFKETPGLAITSMDYYKNATIVSTNKGIYRVKGNDFELFEPLKHLKGERTSLIVNAFGYLWYVIPSKGLYRKNLKTGKEIHYSGAPAYFYNVISLKDSPDLYFGTNNGVYRYNRERDFLKKVNSNIDGVKMGYYVGSSAIDAYETKWFTFDNGLFGITKDNKKVVITSEKYLPSLLLYTLNTDDYGNLLVGSNKGVTVIKVNNEGKVISSRTYDKKSGFEGYETHMRSSFKDKDGTIYLGTLAGLVMVKPKYFQKSYPPNKPVVYSFRNNNIHNLIRKNEPIVIRSENNNLLIRFKSINSKSSFVSYSYRLKGEENEWSDWSKDQLAIFNNLRQGRYTFEVRASVDGKTISDATQFVFRVQIPYYKNVWFIITAIILFGVISVFVLDRTSSFKRRNIIISRDVLGDLKLARFMILFGAIANTGAHLFAPRVDASIAQHDFGAIVSGFILLVFFFITTFVNSQKRKVGLYVLLGFMVLLTYNLIHIYTSDIHPFYLLILILVSFVAPYAFKKLFPAVLLSLFLAVSSVVIIFFVHDAVYNQYLFLLAIAITGILIIFMTYIRNNSLEHLIFTSGIVNKGNTLVVAFNLKGRISYASENIELLLGLNDELKGKPLSFLNQFIPKSDEETIFTNQKLIPHSKEGEIFVTPVITTENKILYYQWSFKEFSKEVKVIMGQNITEKINLESNYELIVRNADDLIFRTDITGNITFANGKCEAFFGKNKSELLGSSLFNLVNASDKNRVRDYFDESFRNKAKGVYIEFPIVNNKGVKKWLGLNLSTIQKTSVENVVSGFLGLARDITKSRKYNAIIEEQNKDITDSINYARGIQFNMLPRSIEFEQFFEEHFVVYRPRNIVSGDFFWLKRIAGKTIIIVSDCTGHGVPGSFMTILGINLLNQIVLEAKTTSPGEILTQLDNRLQDVLPRDGRYRIQDGMETVICVFDNESNKVEYASAGGRFIIVDTEEDKTRVIKGQTKHIGDQSRSDNFSYKTSSLTLNKHEILYLFTDGYPDQFGGSNDKKLTFKKFFSLIEGISQQDLSEQNRMLQEHLTEWIDTKPQTDDITVVAVRGIKK